MVSARTVPRNRDRRLLLVLVAVGTALLAPVAILGAWGVGRGVITAISIPQDSPSQRVRTAAVTANARDGTSNTNRTFQFEVPITIARQIRVGHPVWADFQTRVVSLIEPSGGPGGAKIGAVDGVQIFAITTIR